MLLLGTVELIINIDKIELFGAAYFLLLIGYINLRMIIFERKACVIAGTRTTDLQFSVLAP